MLTKKFTHERVNSKPRKVMNVEMQPFHKLFFDVMHKGKLSRGQHLHEATYKDMRLENALEQEEQINLPSLMIKHKASIVNLKPSPH